MTFKELNQKLRSNFPSKPILHLVDVDKDLMWDTYLNAFPEDKRQEHNCRTCRRFIRNYGNVVSIQNNVTKTIWDFEVKDAELSGPIQALHNLVKDAKVKDVFVTKESDLGTETTHTHYQDTGLEVWNHFHVMLNPYQVTLSDKSVESLQAILRDNATVLQTSLELITLTAIDTVIELIDQKSLYRGEEFLNTLRTFRTIKMSYDKLPEDHKTNFCWEQSATTGPHIAKIKNTSIGTILMDISDGKELDHAVRAFESVMAPANYKRPNPVLTKAMIEKAEKEIATLGLTDSLGRRFATKDDITVDKVLFVNRDKSEEGIFASLKENVPVNPKTLSKVEEVTVQDFIEKILPKSSSIEILFEGRHEANLVSLIAPKSSNSKNLFKWSNPFSWSYRNALADSGMKERVKSAGGKVDGVLRFSIQWNDDDTKYPYDFDAHAYEPDNTHIYFSSFRGSNNRTSMSGNLDVDRTGGPDVMVENITWSDLRKMKDGDYKFAIHNYTGQHCKGFKAEIEFDGEIHQFFYKESFLRTIEVATVTLKNGQFSIKPAIQGSSSAFSREMWGVSTNLFHKVNMITKSPNYWDDNAVGNQHLFFFIDKVKNEETARGFFNEFLNNDLLEHKRVFEALGSKMKVEDSEDQLSGLGFSSTKKEDVIVRVTGSFSRVLKIKF